jgi:hypothetical protein
VAAFGHAADAEVDTRPALDQRDGRDRYYVREGHLGERHAAAATRWMLSLPSNSRRIRRVYSYQWQAECDRHTWDSAWFRPDGAARRSYRTVVAAIARERHLDAAATRALNPPVGPGVTDTCVG